MITIHPLDTYIFSVVESFHCSSTIYLLLPHLPTFSQAKLPGKLKPVMWRRMAWTSFISFCWIVTRFAWMAASCVTKLITIMITIKL